MTTDRYTKVVLTIIAVSLVTIALQHVIPSAFAQSNGITKVAVCDLQYPDLCAEVVGKKGAFSGLITYVATPK
jgi:hypothetical protein